MGRSQAARYVVLHIRKPGWPCRHGWNRRCLRPPYVRTVLRRLEEKGYARHTVDGRTYVYHAAEERARVAAKAVQRIVDWFCNGSMEEVLVGMVDNAMLDQQQLRALADQVAKAKKARGVKKE